MKKKATKSETKKRTPRFDGMLEDGEIKRLYRGDEHVVTVKDGRIEYEGTLYRSLTAVARKITGYPAISGPAFFKVVKQAATV